VQSLLQRFPKVICSSSLDNSKL